MTKEHLDNIRNYIINNIMRNPDFLFSDEVRGVDDDDTDLLVVIASLYEELHHEVTGEDYNYMWHFANKYGAYVDDKLFIDLKEGEGNVIL